VAAPQAAQGPSGNVFLIEMVVIVGIFWFLVLRPQRKQQKELENTLLTLARGDEVTTTGGIIGEVVHVKESLVDGQPRGTLADRVTIRSGESKLVVERGKITRVARAGGDRVADGAKDGRGKGSAGG
jgi:preprotein translocase subunit YajC